MRVDTKSIISDFKEHLKYAGDTTLFSGKFGAGKTTFLQKFGISALVTLLEIFFFI